MGSGALSDQLSKMVAGRSINGRPVHIRQLHPGDSLDGVNVLFISRSHNSRLADILQAAADLPILTVTESQNALLQGGMINFVLVKGRLRFEVALQTATQRRLVISARLLAAAYKVDGALP